MYSWEHKETGVMLEVVRSFSNIDEPPTEEEAPGIVGGTWVRILSGGIGVSKTNAWGFGKGYFNSQTPGRGRQ